MCPERRWCSAIKHKLGIIITVQEVWCCLCGLKIGAPLNNSSIYIWFLQCRRGHNVSTECSTLDWVMKCKWMIVSSGWWKEKEWKGRCCKSCDCMESARRWGVIGRDERLDQGVTKGRMLSKFWRRRGGENTVCLEMESCQIQRDSLLETDASIKKS